MVFRQLFETESATYTYLFGWMKDRGWVAEKPDSVAWSGSAGTSLSWRLLPIWYVWLDWG